MLNPNQQNSKKSLINDLVFFIKNGSISTVSLILPLIAVLLIAVWGIIKSSFFPGTHQFYSHIMLSIATMLIGANGLLYIYRKEMPGPTSSTTIQGWSAIATGILLLLFFGGLGIAGLFFSILEI